MFDECSFVLRQDVGHGVAVEVLVSELLPHQSKVLSQKIFFADLKKKFLLQKKKKKVKRENLKDKTRWGASKVL